MALVSMVMLVWLMLTRPVRTCERLSSGPCAWRGRCERALGSVDRYLLWEEARSFEGNIQSFFCLRSINVGTSHFCTLTASHISNPQPPSCFEGIQMSVLHRHRRKTPHADHSGLFFSLQGHIKRAHAPPLRPVSLAAVHPQQYRLRDVLRAVSLPQLLCDMALYISGAKFGPGPQICFVESLLRSWQMVGKPRRRSRVRQVAQE